MGGFKGIRFFNNELFIAYSVYGGECFPCSRRESFRVGLVVSGMVEDLPAPSLPVKDMSYGVSMFVVFAVGDKCGARRNFSKKVLM